MVILIPWRPIVCIRLLLSAMLWCGYVGSSLMEGKSPFAPYTLQGVHGRHSSRSCIIRYIRVMQSQPLNLIRDQHRHDVRL
jgi:hypothetical protein